MKTQMLLMVPLAHIRFMGDVVKKRKEEMSSPCNFERFNDAKDSEDSLNTLACLKQKNNRLYL